MKHTLLSNHFTKKDIKHPIKQRPNQTKTRNQLEADSKDQLYTNKKQQLQVNTTEKIENKSQIKEIYLKIEI